LIKWLISKIISLNLIFSHWLNYREEKGEFQDKWDIFEIYLNIDHLYILEYLKNCRILIN